MSLYIYYFISIAYWDWGYKEPFSNDLRDPVYHFLFNEKAIGTIPPRTGDLIARPIPDSLFANFTIKGQSDLYNASEWGYATKRQPTLAAGGW